MGSTKEGFVYIVLLQNKYLLFFKKKPQKKGAFLAEVKLFRAKESTSAFEINTWTYSKYKHPKIEEIEDWI